MNWMQLILGIVFLIPVVGCLVIAYAMWTRWTWSKGAEALHGGNGGLRRDRLMWVGYHLLPLTVAGAVLVQKAFEA
ncbi:membrane protein [Gordonia phage Soos]|nr:membrane protein [Gordonia phage Soos]